MTLNITTFLIVCPLVFAAGFVDAIGGGGGLISLPAYLLAGLPPHMAVATNKMSSSCGTLVVTVQMLKNRLVNLRLALPTVILAFFGSSAGARLSLIIPEGVFLKIMIFVFPVCAFCVLNKKLFCDRAKTEKQVTRSTYIIASIAAFVIGIYDGVYGPGTGTLLIIAFSIFAKMDIVSANGQAKVINLTTNLAALAVFLLHGQVILQLGAAAAAANMLGGYIGGHLAIKNGSRLIKPFILAVLTALLVKIVVEL